MNGLIDLLQLLLVPFVFTGGYPIVVLLLAAGVVIYLSWTTYGLMPMSRRRTALLRGLGWWLCAQLLGGRYSPQE